MHRAAAGKGQTCSILQVRLSICPRPCEKNTPKAVTAPPFGFLATGAE